MQLQLPSVTLIGIDCVDPVRLAQAMDISSSGINFGAVKLLTSLEIDDERKISIPHIGSTEEYSIFCLTQLHKYVDTSHVLIIQYDGFILNPMSWKQDFLDYDYIGAPWHIIPWNIEMGHFDASMRGKDIVGNGGFSLRSKKLLALSSKLCSGGKIIKTHPEDIVYCSFYRSEFESLGMKFAPVSLAREFSLEGDYYDYNSQFGFHSFKVTNLEKWFAENQDHESVYQNYRKERDGYLAKNHKKIREFDL
jgi:hypothetical protein